MPTSAEQPPVDGYCAECGFSYDASLSEVLGQLGREAREYGGLLAGVQADRVRRRPDPDTWSALEYACHVRDVLAIQRDRIGLTLAEDRPVYVPMDRERRVVEDRYNEQDPAAVASDLRFNAEAFAEAADLNDEQLGRVGVYNYPSPPRDRPLSWLLRHAAHEVRHHLYDVRRVLSA